ncbi:MAG: hypothetical protein BWY39_00825 [Spirochaetes bacterium ADurb.Bin269]|nr:MAG: hypothetical protein BWY39_00825 [Spirochaetes bacterium ADurb.Bin269]
MVGIAFDDFLDFPARRVFLVVVVQVHDHRSTVAAFGNSFHKREREIVGFLQIVRTLAVGDPLPHQRIGCLLRDDLDLACDHERRIKPDAELADQVGILLRVACELLEERLGAGAGDGAQVRHNIVLVHADTGIAHNQRLFFLVERNVHAGRKLHILVFLVRKAQILQLVQRVGRVRHNLPQENFLVRIERMNDKRQQLVDFSLKLIRCHVEIIS